MVFSHEKYYRRERVALRRKFPPAPLELPYGPSVDICQDIDPGESCGVGGWCGLTSFQQPLYFPLANSPLAVS